VEVHQGFVEDNIIVIFSHQGSSGRIQGGAEQLAIVYIIINNICFQCLVNLLHYIGWVLGILY
jgi:hypothetical protein